MRRNAGSWRDFFRNAKLRECPPLLGSICIASSVQTAAPVAVPVEGERFAAKLVAADAQWQLTFAVGKQQRTLPAADLVCWGGCVEQGRAGGLVLADGSLFAAEVVAADKDRLTVDSDLVGTLKLPLDLLAGIVLHAPSDRQQHDLLLDRLGDCPNFRVGDCPNFRLSENGTVPLRGRNQPTNDSDRLLLDNGDELAGFFEGVADDTVMFKTDAGSVPIKTDRITAILFNPALRRKQTVKPHLQRVWAGFSDGSRLLATELAIKGDSLKITAAGQTLSAARSSLIFLQPLTGRAVYLSDLKPAEYRQTPFILPSPFGRGAGGEGSRESRDLSWPYRLDRNVTSGMLRCGGRLHMKGIGVHSAARLVYTIFPLPLGEKHQNNSPLPLGKEHQNNSSLPLGEGQGVRAAEGSGFRVQGSESPNLQISKSPNSFRRFAAEVGIDDSTANRGSVIFRVLVNGQERFTSPILRGGDAPVPVLVDIRGAKKLELLVDYADHGDVLDHADWLDARLTP